MCNILFLSHLHVCFMNIGKKFFLERQLLVLEMSAYRYLGSNTKNQQQIHCM